jgi:hypothetical protein
VAVEYYSISGRATEEIRDRRSDRVRFGESAAAIPSIYDPYRDLRDVHQVFTNWVFDAPNVRIVALTPPAGSVARRPSTESREPLYSGLRSGFVALAGLLLVGALIIDLALLRDVPEFVFALYLVPIFAVGAYIAVKLQSLNLRYFHRSGSFLIHADYLRAAFISAIAFSAESLLLAIVLAT